MPISTTLVTLLWPVELEANALFANHSCAMISAALRLRLNPCLAVEQKVQSKAQPTCDETHSVPRPGSGMNTVSMALSSSKRNNHLIVPSEDTCSVPHCGIEISAVSRSLARSGRLKSVIASKSLAPRRCIHFVTCTARNAGSPCAAKNSSSCGRVRPNKLRFEVSEDFTACADEFLQV
jgi:hypothetical protein